MRRRRPKLACGHDAGLATLHKDERTAWCPACVADVQLADPADPQEWPIPSPSPGASG